MGGRERGMLRVLCVHVSKVVRAAARCSCSVPVANPAAGPSAEQCGQGRSSARAHTHVLPQRLALAPSLLSRRCHCSSPPRPAHPAGAAAAWRWLQVHNLLVHMHVRLLSGACRCRSHLYVRADQVLQLHRAGAVSRGGVLTLRCVALSCRWCVEGDVG
jgi:hypothetical protein